MKKYSYRSVVKRAKKDARDWKWKFLPFLKEKKPKEPKTDQEIESQFERELLQSGENQISQIAEEWKERDEKFKPDYCAALILYNSAYNTLKEEKGEMSESVKEYKAAKDIFDKFEPPSLKPGWMLFWLIAIGISEFFINSIVLQILGQNQLETYIAAFSMCVIIPLGAHFFGKSLHQTNKSSVDKFWLITVPVIILTLIGGLSFLRSKYFEGMGISKLLGIEVTSTEATIVFIIINIALFVVAAVVSHEGSHHLHKSYSQAKKRFKLAQKELERDESDVKKAARELKAAERDLEIKKHKRAKTHEKLKEEAVTIKEAAEWLISAYRATNLATREDVPECFKKEPKVPVIPQTLLHIDWECTEEEKLSGVKFSQN